MVPALAGRCHFKGHVSVPSLDAHDLSVPCSFRKASLHRIRCLFDLCIQRSIKNSLLQLREHCDRHQPFGIKLQTEYRRATESVDGELSEWHQWLKTQFQTELRMKVQELNHIVSFASMSPKEFDRIMRFVAGKSDLVA